MRKTNQLAIAMLVTAVLMLSACTSTPTGKVTEEKVLKIGVSVPLTGALSDYGKRFIEGATLAIEDIKENSNQKIELKIEDDMCTAKEASNNANLLMNLEGLDKIIVYCGVSSQPFINKMENKSGILFIESIRMISNDGKEPFMFSMKPAVSKEMKILAEQIMNEGIKEVGLVHGQDMFGETYKQKFTEEYTKLGGKVSVIESFDVNAPKDYRTALLKMKSKNIKTCVNMLAQAANYQPLLEQAKELDMGIRLFSPWFTENPTLLKTSGNLSEGIEYTHPFKEFSTPEFQRISTTYQQTYGRELNLDSINGYETILLLGQLNQICGEDTECMVDSLNSGKTFNGILGKISFKDYSYDGQVFMKTVKDGKFVTLE